MYRFIPYTILFVVVTLLQILFFNNLSVSIYLSPLVYVAFIVLLPLQTTRFVTLMAGLAMGVAIDFSMGTSGINTIATLLIAFARPFILNFMVKKDIIAGGGIPSGVLLGEGRFAGFLIILVMMHHITFFAFESLSIENINLYLLRCAVSSGVSIVSIWIISRLFLTMVFSYRK